jgi:hypothetical protein
MALTPEQVEANRRAKQMGKPIPYPETGSAPAKAPSLQKARTVNESVGTPPSTNNIVYPGGPAVGPSISGFDSTKPTTMGPVLAADLYRSDKPRGALARRIAGAAAEQDMGPVIGPNGVETFKWAGGENSEQFIGVPGVGKVPPASLRSTMAKSAQVPMMRLPSGQWVTADQMRERQLAQGAGQPVAPMMSQNNVQAWSDVKGRGGAVPLRPGTSGVVPEAIPVEAQRPTWGLVTDAEGNKRPMIANEVRPAMGLGSRARVNEFNDQRDAAAESRIRQASLKALMESNERMAAARNSANEPKVVGGTLVDANGNVLYTGPKEAAIAEKTQIENKQKDLSPWAGGTIGRDGLYYPPGELRKGFRSGPSNTLVIDMVNGTPQLLNNDTARQEMKNPNPRFRVLSKDEIAFLTKSKGPATVGEPSASDRKEAMDWIAANPNDPRVPAIKKKLGVG